MATLYETLSQQAQHENMRKLQYLLSMTEGSSAFANPYLAKGGTRNQMWTSYANHPYFIDPNAAKWKFKWNNGKEDYATAHGKYMIRQNTWQGINRGLGRNLTFSPQDQDVAMTYLVQQRGALNDVLQGNWQNVFKKLGSEWASLPTSPYAQHKFSDKGFIKALEKVGIDPKLAGYNGQFNVNTAGLPVQQPSPSPHTVDVLGGAPAAYGHWRHQPTTDPVQKQTDFFAQQAPRQVSNGLAELTGQTRVMGVDYLDKYFAALKRKQNTPQQGF